MVWQSCDSNMSLKTKFAMKAEECESGHCTVLNWVFSQQVHSWIPSESSWWIKSWQSLFFFLIVSNYYQFIVISTFISLTNKNCLVCELLNFWTFEKTQIHKSGGLRKDNIYVCVIQQLNIRKLKQIHQGRDHRPVRTFNPPTSHSLL